MFFIVLILYCRDNKNKNSDIFLMSEFRNVVSLCFLVYLLQMYKKFFDAPNFHASFFFVVSLSDPARVIFLC